jgi:hypothetical protein
MYHLFSRVYLEVDSLKSDKHTFYLASAQLAENYDERLGVGPVMVGKTQDEAAFIDEGFVELLAKFVEAGDAKLVIYVSLETYGALVAMWLKAIFPNAQDDQIKTLLNLEMLTLHAQGVGLPDPTTLKTWIENLSRTPREDKLRTLTQDLTQRVSLEYKLLDHLSGNKRASIAESIRVFALRGVLNTLDETQRNLTLLFFSDYMQEKYGYTAKDHLGEVDLLSKIPRLTMINNPKLRAGITRLKPAAIEAVVSDYALYLEQSEAIEKTQVSAERAKLKIVNTSVPMGNNQVTDLFIDMLRASNEHTDYLDWADLDKLNVHLIHWAVSLSPEACKGFEL